MKTAIREHGVLAGVLLVGVMLLVLMSWGASMATAKPAKGGKTLFSSLVGSWNCTSCWIRPVNGQKERVACKVVYRGGGKNLKQSINCRGSMRLNSTSNLRAANGRKVTGSWSAYNNHTGRGSGGASGVMNASRLSLGLSSNKGDGAIRIQLRGANRHIVTMYKYHAGKKQVVGQLSLRR